MPASVTRNLDTLRSVVGILAVFFANCDGDNFALLELCLRDRAVNGMSCEVIRDSAATIDIFHDAFLKPEDFTGICAWIRQGDEENNVCLRTVTLKIEGPSYYC